MYMLLYVPISFKWVSVIVSVTWTVGGPGHTITIYLIFKGFKFDFESEPTSVSELQAPDKNGLV